MSVRLTAWTILMIHISGADGFLNLYPVQLNGVESRQSAFSPFRHGLNHGPIINARRSLKKPCALGAAMMLSAENIFQVENVFIIPFWLCMIVAPNSKVDQSRIWKVFNDNLPPIDCTLQITKQIMSSYALFIPLSVLYIWLLVAGLTSPGNNST